MTDTTPPYIDVSVLFAHRLPFLQQHIPVLKSRDHTSTSETIVYKLAQEVFGRRCGKNRIVADAKFGSSYPRYYRSSASRPLCWFVSAYRRSRRGSRTSTWLLDFVRSGKSNLAIVDYDRLR